jgi:phospholipid/cholesterol/gamma-HCH transport system substrate-binding protein
VARTPTLEKPASLRLLGIGLLLVCLFFLWLTWAFFSKTFTEYDDVKLTTSKSGLSLPNRADVKLRGMIVGVVREVHVENGHVAMTLGMDPKVIDRVPAGVRAEIVPKTLFGEKYVNLVPTGSAGGSLRAGDTISDAKVPVEFEEFFNDIYPILTAVPPEKVGYTLTALANTLEGRGNSLGETLDVTNTYLQKLNPETQQAVDDVVALGEVSDTYAGEMKDFGTLLRNSAKVSRTVEDKKHELGDVFDETDNVSDVLRDFFAASGDDIVATVDNSVQPLKVGAEYSSVFPCWFKGLDTLITTKLNDVWNNNTLHIDLIMVSPQPTVYDVNNERPVIPTEESIEAVDITQPEVHGYTSDGHPRGLGTICDELNAAAAGNSLRTPANPLPVPTAIWQLIGIKNSHNGKLGTDADYNRSEVGR